MDIEHWDGIAIGLGIMKHSHRGYRYLTSYSQNMIHNEKMNLHRNYCAGNICYLYLSPDDYFCETTCGRGLGNGKGYGKSLDEFFEYCRSNVSGFSLGFGWGDGRGHGDCKLW